jgi:hypothetical protein
MGSIEAPSSCEPRSVISRLCGRHREAADLGGGVEVVRRQRFCVVQLHVFGRNHSRPFGGRAEEPWALPIELLMLLAGGRLAQRSIS